jgi:hypothetical protein
MKDVAENRQLLKAYKRYLTYHSQQLFTSMSANNLVGEFSNSSHSSLLSFARP